MARRTVRKEVIGLWSDPPSRQKTVKSGLQKCETPDLQDKTLSKSSSIRVRKGGA